MHPRTVGYLLLGALCYCIVVGYFLGAKNQRQVEQVHTLQTELRIAQSERQLDANDSANKVAIQFANAVAHIDPALAAACPKSVARYNAMSTGTMEQPDGTDFVYTGFLPFQIPKQGSLGWSRRLTYDLQLMDFVMGECLQERSTERATPRKRKQMSGFYFSLPKGAMVPSACAPNTICKAAVQSHGEEKCTDAQDECAEPHR